MPLYRVLKNLSTKSGLIPHGCVENLPWHQSKLDALEAAGAISRVASPPLSELPGWEERASLLLPEIVVVEDFLLADNTVLAGRLSMDAADMDAVKAGARAWLQNPNPSQNCGCK